MIDPLLQRTTRREDGSTVLAVLAILSVTLVLIGAALSEASQRFRTGHHSSRWSQASHAAEAGIDVALMAANKSAWTANGWSSAPGSPGASPITKTVSFSDGVAGVGPTSAILSVDQVSMNGSLWMRIRSTGMSDVFGGAYAGMDRRDSLLRKLTLRKERQTGMSVTTPRATRTIEVLASPRSTRPFKYTFVSKQLFDIHTQTTLDSYDSRDPNKSNFGPFGTYGVYTAAKKQNHGDAATIDALNTWNINDAHVWGDLHTPSGAVDHEGNVHGTVHTGFTFTFPDEIAPVWTTVTQNHGVISNVSRNIVGGTEANPTRHKFTSINLSSDNRAINIQNPAGQTRSWVEVWVTGDTFIDAKNLTGINIAPGVTATIHFGGRVEVKGGNNGYAIKNGSELPARLIVRAYGGSSGSIKDFILYNTNFHGAVSAPWYKVKFDLANKHVHGSFLTWQFDVSDSSSLHYDEALEDLELPVGSGFTVRSWVELVR